MSVVWQKKMHGVPNRRDKVNPTTTRLFALGGGVLAVVAALYLALSASTVRLSNRIWSQHNELALIQRHNSYLETEIARKGSIPVLQKRSIEMGYQPAESVEYVTVGVP